jgi:hypothetical protein
MRTALYKLSVVFLVLVWVAILYSSRLPFDSVGISFIGMNFYRIDVGGYRITLDWTTGGINEFCGDAHWIRICDRRRAIGAWVVQPLKSFQEAGLDLEPFSNMVNGGSPTGHPLLIPCSEIPPFTQKNPLPGVTYWVVRSGRRSLGMAIVETRTIERALAVLSGILLIPMARKMARAMQTWHRRTSGRCPKCGYDLRMTPQRCPECGAVPSIGSTTIKNSTRDALP